VQTYGAALGDETIDDERLLALLPEVVERGYAIAEWPAGVADQALLGAPLFNPWPMRT